MEIRYAYSTNLAYKTEPKKTLKTPKLLAMSFSREEEDSDLRFLQTYDEIPFSAREIATVDKKFRRAKVTRLLGKEATKAAFMTQVPSFDLLHLAIHGRGDPTSALTSHLAFRNENTRTDGLLYAHELYTLDLSLRLAVLSACETGIGQVYQGEGIFSIARGFAYAGTPTLLLSLWKADDYATSHLMGFFYHHLNQGATVSKALQLAKLEFLDQENPEATRPCFWGGFVVFCVVRGVVNYNKKWVWFVAIVLL
jgi:CHAT domain-containing protein